MIAAVCVLPIVTGIWLIRCPWTNAQQQGGFPVSMYIASCKIGNICHQKVSLNTCATIIFRRGYIFQPISLIPPLLRTHSAQLEMNILQNNGFGPGNCHGLGPDPGQPGPRSRRTDVGWLIRLLRWSRFWPRQAGKQTKAFYKRSARQVSVYY